MARRLLRYLSTPSLAACLAAATAWGLGLDLPSNTPPRDDPERGVRVAAGDLEVIWTTYGPADPVERRRDGRPEPLAPGVTLVRGVYASGSAVPSGPDAAAGNLVYAHWNLLRVSLLLPALALAVPPAAAAGLRRRAAKGGPSKRGGDGRAGRDGS